MARVSLAMPKDNQDPEIEGILAWVTQMEGSVPNHFYVELNFPEFFTAKLGATKVLWEAGELDMTENPAHRHFGFQSQRVCLLHRCLLHHFKLWTADC